MADPFATGLAALHRAAGSVAARYYPAGAGTGVLIRVVRGQADRLTEWAGEQPIIQASNILDLRRADAPDAAAGDVLELDTGERLVLVGEPIGDAEGLTWRIGAEADPT